MTNKNNTLFNQLLEEKINLDNQKKWLFRSSLVIMLILFVTAILLAYFTMALSDGEPSKTATTITVILLTIPIKIHRDLLKYIYK